MIKKYRKKPVVIAAVRIDPSTPEAEILAFMEETKCPFEMTGDHEMTIHTLEGDMHLSRGDWLIRGVEGEFYPCNPKIFEMTYEEVDGEEEDPGRQRTVIEWLDYLQSPDHISMPVTGDEVAEIIKALIEVMD